MGKKMRKNVRAREEKATAERGNDSARKGLTRFCLLSPALLSSKTARQQNAPARRNRGGEGERKSGRERNREKAA